MPKNKVRPSEHTFALAQAWKTFKKKIRNDAVAADHIFAAKQKAGLIKCICETPNIIRQRGSRTYDCMSCKKQYWLTSGSLFENATRLRAWLAALWFKQKGVAISSLLLSKFLDIAQSTALNIQKKVSMVLLEDLPDNSLLVAVNSLITAVIKRSKDSLARLHPRAELEKLEQEAPSSFLDDSGNLRQFLAPQFAKQIQSFLRLYFHGVSIKYMQLYLVSYCCFMGQNLWDEDAILLTCLSHKPISDVELAQYSSPFFLKILST